MKQKKINTIENKDTAQDLKKRFEELRAKEIPEATTKIVNFKKIVGCGCGSSFEWFHAEVPINSSLEDGDYVNDFEDYDMTNITEGRYYGN